MILDYKPENNDLNKPSLWEELSQRSKNKIELKIRTTDTRIKRLELFKSEGENPVDCGSGSQLLDDPNDTENFQQTGAYSVWFTVIGLTPAQKYNFIVCAYDINKSRVAKSDILTIFTDAELQHYTLVSNESYWGAYAKNNKINHYESDDLNTACEPLAVSNPFDCVHLGGMKKVFLTGVSNCTDISFKDVLDLFHWSCDDSVGVATLTAQGFKKEKSLSDAIDFDQLKWKSNKISVWQDSSKIIDSILEPWWTNPIEEIISSGQVLSHSNKVYVYSGSTPVDNVTINGSSITLVMNKDGVFNYGFGSAQIGVNIDTSNFVWIEGNLTGYSGDAAVKVNNSRFINIHNLKSIKSDKALQIVSSNFVHVKDSVFGFSSDGINISDGSNILIDRVHSTNNDFDGIKIMSSPTNIRVINSVFANNSFGIKIGSSLEGQNYFSFSNFLNNTQDGFKSINQSTVGELFLNNLYTQNNANDGLELGETFFESYEIHLSNILSMNNGQASYNFINLNDSSLYVKDALYHEGGQEVNNSAFPAPPSLIIGQQILNKTTWENSLVGKVNSDSVQISVEDSSSVLDTVRQSFENSFRFWSKKSLESYPSSLMQGSCNGSVCMILDTSFNSSSELLGRSHDYQAMDPLVFKPHESCPESLDSTNSNNITTAGSKQHLLYAVEVTDDYLGNNDGFCEANERCIWTPNIGAYQGHGKLDYGKTCNYSTSNLDYSNIKLIAYPNNGR
ncbi:MAG: right-handed parallel beta-helix repeat-containing protein [Bdellovibrionales bacterium]|nr:right-handed parallel beta-helix repeat-containing protein [Bdellovibrionales bacterium]